MNDQPLEPVAIKEPKKMGHGKLIRIRGRVNTLMLSGLDLTLEFDRADILEGNLLLLNGKRYFICARDPEQPTPGCMPKVTLRADTMTREQRRNAKHNARMK